MITYNSLTDVYVPIGMVMPFSTSIIPSVFVECDGTQLLKTWYHTLHDIIGDTYGETDGANGVGTTHFRVPDYTDFFLRGTDLDGVTDPEPGIRTDRGDGQTGAAVGTKQTDQYLSHYHHFEYWYKYWAGGTSYPARPVMRNSGPGVVNRTSDYSGGSETRPSNVRVLFAMRVI